jgi:hypothetical protein
MTLEQACHEAWEEYCQYLGDHDRWDDDANLIGLTAPEFMWRALAKRGINVPLEERKP